MLTNFDYGTIAFYFLFIASLGFVFRKFNGKSADYFAGGHKMNWWLLGASTFIANFSSWTFTGAANMAYTYGVIILAIYITDVVGFIFSVLWFAPWFRQMRLVTAIDAVRDRFGRVNEQFYNWITIFASFVGGAVWLVGLSIILSSVLGVSQIYVVVGTGVTVVIMALLGGSWAVVASDFIQVVLLITVSIATAVLTVIKVGGVGAFIDQVPVENFVFLQPLGSIKYDWLYVCTMVVSAIYVRNSLMMSAKYIAAKDSSHARKSAMVPMIGYIVLPIFWFIPPFAAHSLVPDLATEYSMFNVPGEASYIAVCLKVLPQGMLGLMIAGLFAATMSSMDTALNKNAGFLVKNFYQPILRKDASDKELLLAGQGATMLCGALIIICALILVTGGKISLFDLFQYMNSYLTIPMAIPLFLGILVKRVPLWSPIATVLFGVLLSIFVFNVAPTEFGKNLLTPIIGEACYGYVLTNNFTITNIFTVPLIMAFFLGTKLFYNEERAKNYQPQVDKFFKQMKTPVDFEKEVGGDTSKDQAKVMGWLAVVYGSFILAMTLIPNPLSGRLAIFFCAAVMLGIGGALLVYSKRVKTS